jgi:hypothetical protein
VVWVASVTVRVLGVLRLSLAVTAGQLIGSLVLDEVWPEPGTSIGISTVLGAVLTVIAVAVANLRTVPDDRGRAAELTGDEDDDGTVSETSGAADTTGAAGVSGDAGPAGTKRRPRLRRW